MNDITENGCVECSNCFKVILVPARANDDDNARLYGKRINGYCRTCVRHFIQNEIEDGVRNPDGTRK
jgi:hypothetical protein